MVYNEYKKYNLNELWEKIKKDYLNFKKIKGAEIEEKTEELVLEEEYGFF